MVVVGNFRNRAELRKKPRRQFQFTARIFINKETLPIKCMIANVSGARLVLEKGQDLLERFVLLITENGSAWCNCRIFWRTGPAVGVEFTNGLAMKP